MREMRKMALLVVIPGADLRAAEREADSVEHALDAAGWTVLRRDGETATVAEILRILREEDLGLLHYIGHGSRRGPDANDSYLRLARGGKLRLSDVLALPRAPQRVVLSSCEGDAAGDGALVAGMGIGPAFVISGADVAVALVGRPKDSQLAELNSMLYGKFLTIFLRDPAAALRETMSALRTNQGTTHVVFPTLRTSTR
jgi:CHAT domain-containing protein